MHKATMVFLLAATLLIAGCGEPQQLINETNQTSASPEEPQENTTPTNETLEPEPIQEEEPETIEPEPEPIVTPESFNIILTGISVEKTMYDEEEQHELRMILSKEQHQKTQTVILSYKPICNKASKMLMSVNKEIISANIPECGKNNQHVIPGEHFLEGQNAILFQNKVEETYELSDITLEFMYNDGTSETLEAQDHLFKPGSGTRQEVADLAIASMTNTVERRFTLSEHDLNRDIYLEFDTTAREGEVTIELNGQVIYQGKPKQEGQAIALPHEHLEEGRNILIFIAQAKS